ncbi:MAG: hypothetical protein IJN53_07460 [Oscillospiraceae bacterium]|nr:hypothetical protein [Oscillospiraceae bacterium]
MRVYPQASPQMGIGEVKAADFFTGQARKTQEYFVYFKFFWRGAGGKDALSAGEAYQGLA